MPGMVADEIERKCGVDHLLYLFYRCLTDGAGDVAFVRGRTVLGKSREKNTAVIAFN